MTRPHHAKTSPIVTVLSKGNLFTNVSGRTTGSGTAFTAPYAYTLASTSGLASAIMSGAGVH